MKFKINKFAGFREICDFFLEVGKFSDSKLEISEIFGIFCQKHPLGEAFFSKGFPNKKKIQREFPLKLTTFFIRDFPLKFTRDFLIKKIYKGIPFNNDDDEKKSFSEKRKEKKEQKRKNKKRERMRDRKKKRRKKEKE